MLLIQETCMYPRRHPGEGRGPEKIRKTWIPASAGTTRPRPRREQGSWIRGRRLKSTTLGLRSGVQRSADCIFCTDLTKPRSVAPQNPFTVRLSDSSAWIAKWTLFSAIATNGRSIDRKQFAVSSRYSIVSCDQSQWIVLRSSRPESRLCQQKRREQ
jgi:hypothetical protein